MKIFPHNFVLQGVRILEQGAPTLQFLLSILIPV